MSTKSLGRRGLFGVLAGAPLAAAAAAQGVSPPDIVVNIANEANGLATVVHGASRRGGVLNLDVLVEPLEQKLASRLARGRGALGKIMQSTYGMQTVGR